MIEYERMYSIHLRYFAILVVCSGLVGMIIGLGWRRMVGRDSIAPQHSDIVGEEAGMFLCTVMDPPESRVGTLSRTEED